MDILANGSRIACQSSFDAINDDNNDNVILMIDEHEDDDGDHEEELSYLKLYLVISKTNFESY